MVRQQHTGGTFVRFLLSIGAVVTSTALGSCVIDPVQDGAVKALGPETELAETEYHRPGQPCLTCHGVKGPAKSRFSMGGTVYYLPDDEKRDPVPVEGAEVLIRDANGADLRVRSNCKGNFFIRYCQRASCPPYNPGEYTLSAEITFPFFVTVAQGGTYKQMQGHVGRDGSCAGCHRDPPFYDSPGHVFLYSGPGDIPGGQVPQPQSCPPSDLPPPDPGGGP
jgi:hypothetical protein